MSDNILRKKVKMLKATDSIRNYYEIAELLEMSKASFYNWLNEKYNLGYERKAFLKEIIVAPISALYSKPVLEKLSHLNISVITFCSTQ